MVVHKVEVVQAVPVSSTALIKGALAGLAGGIAGTTAKVMCEQVVPPWIDQTPPQVLLAERAAGRRFDPVGRKVAMQTIHWSFGVIAGAAYGAVVEARPRAAAWHGLAFGLALNRLAQENLMPEAELVPPADRQPMQERVSQWLSHAVYGLVAETVRRRVRAGIE